MRIDEVAVGDPIDFTLRCVREHLPEMLDNAGQPALAARARADLPKVLAALDTVGDLMARAR